MHFITDEFNVIRYSEANNNVHYVKNIRICVSEFLIGENAIMTRQLVKSDSGKYDFVFYNQCPIPANANMGTFFGPVKSAETMRSYLPKLLKPRGLVIFAALGDRRVNDDIQALKDTREDMIRRHNNTHIFETLRSMGMKYIELSELRFWPIDANLSNSFARDEPLVGHLLGHDLGLVVRALSNRRLLCFCLTAFSY